MIDIKYKYHDIILHRLALLPAQDKDIMRQQLFSTSCCHPF